MYFWRRYWNACSASEVGPGVGPRFNTFPFGTELGGGGGGLPNKSDRGDRVTF